MTIEYSQFIAVRKWKQWNPTQRDKLDSTETRDGYFE